MATPHGLKMRAVLRRYAQSQSKSQLQNSLMQVGTSSERAKPDAEIGTFQQFDADAGRYVFNTSTSSVQVTASQVLSNGKLGKGQKALLAQGTADFIPA